MNKNRKKYKGKCRTSLHIQKFNTNKKSSGELKIFWIKSLFSNVVRKSGDKKQFIYILVLFPRKHFLFYRRENLKFPISSQRYWKGKKHLQFRQSPQ